MLLKPTLLAGAFLLASLNAQADLTNYTANGTEIVYDSFSNVTWTKDSNMLESLYTEQGYSAVVNAIIAVSPTITNTPNFLDGYTGTYSLTAIDFDSDGRTTWFGALAYVNYLNSINYGGSKSWYLPTAVFYPGSQIEEFGPYPTIGSAKGNELSELHRGLYDASTGFKDPSDYFNVEYGNYWYGTETNPSNIPAVAWAYLFNEGAEDVNLIIAEKSNHLYAWAVNPGQVSAVPEPESFAMLLAGLGVLGFATRRKQK